jgi:hypothetical protein
MRANDAPDRHIVLRLPDSLAERMRKKVRAGIDPNTSFMPKSRSSTVAMTVRIERAAESAADDVESTAEAAIRSVKFRVARNKTVETVGVDVVAIDVTKHNRIGVFTLRIFVKPSASVRIEWLREEMLTFVVEDEAPFAEDEAPFAGEIARRGGFASAMRRALGRSTHTVTIDAPYVVPQEFDFVFEGVTYPATLVDLPCVTEVYKTKDRVALYKAGDIGQALIVRERDESAQLETRLGRDAVEPMHGHGLAPPSQHVIQQRWRRTTSRQDLDAPPVNATAQVEFTPIPEECAGLVDPLRAPPLVQRFQIHPGHSHDPRVYATELDLVQLAQLSATDKDGTARRSLATEDVVFRRRGMVREPKSHPMRDYVVDDRPDAPPLISHGRASGASASASAATSRSGSPVRPTQPTGLSPYSRDGEFLESMDDDVY